MANSPDRTEALILTVVSALAGSIFFLGKLGCLSGYLEQTLRQELACVLPVAVIAAGVVILLAHELWTLNSGSPARGADGRKA